VKNREPEDQAPWPGESTLGLSAPNKPKGRRRLIVTALVVVAVIAAYFYGHAGSGHSTPVALASPTASATDPATMPPAVVSTTPEAVATTPSATDTPTDGSTLSDPTATGPAQPEYLSETTSVDDSGLRSPVDAKISGTDYPNSVQQYADTGNGDTTVWDVTAYSTFKAEIGIDDSTSADGKTARVVFMNQASVQLGTVQVSVGAPVQVSIPLKGAVHLEIECITEQYGDYDITLGNAQFLP
jgi:hypothetical protein